MMGKKTTQASHQALLFEEVLILKPHAENTDQQAVEYTLIAFTVFSESHGRGGDTGNWYLFDDEKITKKCFDFATMTTKGNIGNQVTSLYYLKNEEATMKTMKMMMLAQKREIWHRFKRGEVRKPQQQQHRRTWTRRYTMEMM
jgi:hypothetical protein